MLLDKKDLPLVAEEFMNDVHLEDLEIINSLYDLISNYDENLKDEVIYKYELWYRHTVNHFKGEEVIMEEKRFPPYPFHKAEHDKTLEKMSEVLNNFKASNDITILKNYFENELPSWLINHIETMDTITAVFFKTGMMACHGVN